MDPVEKCAKPSRCYSDVLGNNAQNKDGNLSVVRADRINANAVCGENTDTKVLEADKVKLHPLPEFEPQDCINTLLVRPGFGDEPSRLVFVDSHGVERPVALLL